MYTRSAPGMPQDTSFGGLICPGVVQERGYGVPAVMCGVLAAVDPGHDLVPDGAVPGVAVSSTIGIRDQHLSRAVHPGGYERQDPVMDGDGPDPGLCLGPDDPDGLLPEADICFTEGQLF